MRSFTANNNRLGLVVSLLVIVLLSCRLGGFLDPGDEEPTSAPVAENDRSLVTTPESAVEAPEDNDTAPQGIPEMNAESEGEQDEPAAEQSPPPSSSRIESLSLADLSADIPDNILQEVSFGGGGGGGSECGETFADNNRQDTVIADGYISIDTCYWDGDTTVEIVILSPSGQELSRETKVASEFLDVWTVNAFYLYDPLEVELGEPYVFRFESDTKGATVEVTLIPADSPVKGFSGDTTVFYNFRPGETVDVFYYEVSDRRDVNDPLITCGLSSLEAFELKGRRTYQADEKGRVILGISQDSRYDSGQVNYYEADHYLAAVGEQSGEAIDSFAAGRDQRFIVSQQSLAEREQLKQACYAGHKAADELIDTLSDFLGAAIESEIAAYGYSDPQLAADYYTGDVFDNISTSIAELDTNNAYAVSTFDFTNSYYTNERSMIFGDYLDGYIQGIETSVWVDSCELWQTSYYSKLDDQLLLAEPTQLVPQSIRIDLNDQGNWQIARVNFKDPPAFCTDLTPDLYTVP